MRYVHMTMVLLLMVGSFCHASVAEKKPIPLSFYPNFSDNPAISKKMYRWMSPYLLPLGHHLKHVLDAIFAHSRAIEDTHSLRKAHFTILFSQKKSGIIVAKHPKVPGYLFKIYMDSQHVRKQNMTGWKLLATRCIVAHKIRNLIRKKHLSCFTIADKWLYPLPIKPKSRYSKPEPVVLLVKDMHIYNPELSRRAWQTKVTKKHLRQLYAVLGRGYGSACLHKNVPYTKKGTFAFIDTEFNKRKIPLEHAKYNLSKKHGEYWDYLMKR